MGQFLPLQDITVLDFSKILAGPMCTQYLGDLGADVIKVEAREQGDDTRQWPPFTDGEGTIFLSVNRIKRSLAVDLKAPAGRELCERLAKSADVVVESFGPGVAERLGIGYERLSAINPRLVYCSLSGYGTRGPMKDGKGYDLVLQAFCGMLSMTGEPGGPPMRSPFSPVDQGAGLHATIGILGGLLQRAQTAKGVKIEASLFDAAVGFLAYFLQGYWQRGTEPVKPGSGHESLCPYQAFETMDKPLILGIANDGLWRTFCELVGAPGMAADPRFLTGADRVANRSATVAEVERIMRTRTRGDWMKTLDEAGIPCSPVHALGELASHPHTLASEMIQSYRNNAGQTVNCVAAPLRVDGSRPGLRRAPPRHGQDTRAILAEYGYSDADVASMIAAGVVSPGRA